MNEPYPTSEPKATPNPAKGKRFFPAFNALVDDHLSQLSARALPVLLKLMRRSKSDWTTFIKPETIAAELGWCMRSVRSALSELAAAGFVKIDRGGGRGKRSTYRVCIPPETMQELALFKTPETVQVCVSKLCKITTKTAAHTLSKDQKYYQKGAKPTLPSSLQSDRFKAIWTKWIKHRTEIKHPLKPTTEAAQLAKCAELGEAVAIAKLETAMINGWQGFHFEDKNHGNKNKPTAVRPGEYEPSRPGLRQF